MPQALINIKVAGRIWISFILLHQSTPSLPSASITQNGFKNRMKNTSVLNPNARTMVSDTKTVSQITCLLFWNYDNIIIAFFNAAMKASTSLFSLYNPNETRTVPGTPIASINGSAQWCPVRTATPCWSSKVPTSNG